MWQMNFCTTKIIDFRKPFQMFPVAELSIKIAIGTVFWHTKIAGTQLDISLV